MAKLSTAQVNALMVFAYYLPFRGQWHGSLKSLADTWNVRRQTAQCLCAHGLIALTADHGGKFTSYAFTPALVEEMKAVLSRNAF